MVFRYFQKMSQYNATSVETEIVKAISGTLELDNLAWYLNIHTGLKIGGSVHTSLYDSLVEILRGQDLSTIDFEGLKKLVDDFKVFILTMEKPLGGSDKMFNSIKTKMSEMIFQGKRVFNDAHLNYIENMFK